ncbi:hypothetical protein ASU31_21120 [Pedobacter ginsenosidimutans]|uniref:DUF5013 domain-containing protein n=2 Tax=Pedobacter ginsenosidimutans TaxID=687842 RepID=A0A0T5VK61_9SPHI|nr:hypothetical protein ASU31_21120 [Pedobacter ginsenosidimutans]
MITLNKIKMKRISKKINIRLCQLGVALLLITAIAACTKKDDYKKFIEGGEISYTGKLDSVKINSGKYRVLINGLFIADPKVKKCVVYWNNKADSVIIPVTRTPNVDTLKFFINNMKEGVQNFIIYTYDGAGNKSIPVYKTGRVYGDRYQVTLSNRAINSAFTNENGVTTLELGGMDRVSGVFATEVIYTDNANANKTVRIPINTNNFTLANFKEKGTIKYRTLFLPDTLSVDTFYTDYTSLYVPKFIKVDVTSTYLKNVGPNVSFSSINSGNRWGILSDWITSASVKNASGFGGYEKKSNVGYISLEAGWGLPNVTDGKIYQTVSLPAGNYRFEIVMTDFNAGGSRYLTVAEGTTIPNVANITSSSIAFSNLESKTLNFELLQSKQVSLGFAASLTGTGSTGQYAKIASVKLYKINYL